MYQCLKCKKIYEEDKAPLLTGCSEPDCGSHLFLRVRDDTDFEKIEGFYDELIDKVDEIDVYKKTHPETGEEPKAREIRVKRKTQEKHIDAFGIETIKETQPGVYELNLQGLFDRAPIIVLSKEGSYIISLPSVFG